MGTRDNKMQKVLFLLTLLLLSLSCCSVKLGLGFSLSKSVYQCSKSSYSNENVGREMLLANIRGGYTKKTKASKKSSLDGGFMLKSFIVSLYDPTVGGLVDNGNIGHVVPSKSSKDKKKSSAFGGMFGSFGGGGSGGSFGPVCGPNGCH